MRSEPFAKPAIAIGLRTQRYGPATTRRFAIAEGSGVPSPLVDMATAEAIPRALAVIRSATPTGTANAGNGTASDQCLSRVLTTSGTTTRKTPQNTTIWAEVVARWPAAPPLRAGRNANGPRSSH